MSERAQIEMPPVSARGARGRYDAIVVGTGVGGVVTAALLAHHGLRVLVIEKNPVVGGILASYRRDGFKMDVGSHLVPSGERGPLGRVLRMVGLARPRFLTHPIPVRSRGMFPIAAPAHRRGLARTAWEAARLLRLPARDALGLLRMMLHVFTLTPWELARWERRTLDQFVRRYTEHPGAYFLMSFMASIFFVLPPWELSAAEAIRGLRHVIGRYSLSYVEGGMDAIPHALLGRVTRAGGEVLAGRRVTAIRRAGRLLQVGTDDGAEYTAPAVACNLAPIDLLALLDDLAIPPWYCARVAAIRPSGNAHQIKLALRRPLVEEGCLIGGVSLGGLTLADLSIDLMERTVTSISAGRVSDPIALYAPVPSNFDPSIAPPGRQLIAASVYGPTIAHPADGAERWRAEALRALASVIPHLEEELLFAEFTPIPGIGAWMGKSGNGAICNGQYPGQTGRDRLPVATPIPGLWLCGDGAGGRGIGTELAARSGIEAARGILAARRPS